MIRNTVNADATEKMPSALSGLARASANAAISSATDAHIPRARQTAPPAVTPTSKISSVVAISKTGVPQTKPITRLANEASTAKTSSAVSRRLKAFSISWRRSPTSMAARRAFRRLAPIGKSRV